MGFHILTLMFLFILYILMFGLTSLGLVFLRYFLTSKQGGRKIFGIFVGLYGGICALFSLFIIGQYIYVTVITDNWSKVCGTAAGLSSLKNELQTTGQIFFILLLGLTIANILFSARVVWLSFFSEDKGDKA